MKAVGNFLQNYLLYSFYLVNKKVGDFLDTSPDMIGEDVAEKLKDKEEARKLMEDIKRERSGGIHEFSVK
ncbi:MAG: hypothetical protein RIE86_15675 [Imperialibacter sp.]|uniref:hypothetical protein n=1 Tax=Imperialibacter sp. TaxID=2038411 RepID=UPI0032ECE68E